MIRHLSFILWLFIPWSLTGATTAQNISAKIQHDTTVVESLTIPSPGEFFAAIDKGGQIAWMSAGRASINLTAPTRAQSAFSLGMLIADAYIAIENFNSREVKNIGRDILSIAKVLNVDDSVRARGNSINDFAENNNWNALREEIEATQNEIKLALAQQQDQDFIALISLGAWLRSLQAASALITQTYSAETAALLPQPAIASLFLTLLNQLPLRIKSELPLESISQALEQLSMNSAHDESSSLEKVTQINEVASKAITFATSSLIPTPINATAPSTQVISPSPLSPHPNPQNSPSQQIQLGLPVNLTDPEAELRARALELANAFVTDGFKTRDGIWTGELSTPPHPRLTVNLFSGNQYWFTVASLAPPRTYTIQLFDNQGRPIKTQNYTSDTATTIGFVATRTGIYYIQVEAIKLATAPFCLVYSYK